MLRESEIEEAARLLLAVRGICAEGRAQKRASDFAREGNGDAAQIWRRIADKIATIGVRP